MGAHMKTTIDIADELLLRAKERARMRHITLRQLMEDALAVELERKEEGEVPSMVVVDGAGLVGDYCGASWEKIRNAAYGVES